MADGNGSGLDIRRGAGCLVIAVVAVIVMVATGTPTDELNAGGARDAAHDIAVLIAFASGGVGLWLLLRGLFRS